MTFDGGNLLFLVVDTCVTCHMCVDTLLNYSNTFVVFNNTFVVLNNMQCALVSV